MKSANDMDSFTSRLACVAICGETRGGTSGGTPAAIEAMEPFCFSLFRSKLLLRACRWGLSNTH